MEPAQETTKPTRILSIDALRGFDMFWIVGGGAIFGSLDGIFKHPVTATIKTQLEHVRWEGFRFEDLIMPLFLFITGVVMPISFARRLASGQSKARLYGHVIARVLILWVLGMIKQGHLLEFELGKLHFYSNTLQAIAAGYLIAAVVILNLRPVGQVIVWLVLLLVFWGLMALVPVPGHGAGVLTEDGNLAIYIDKLILGRFQDGTPYSWILSSVTFATTVLMGVFAGRWLTGSSRGFVKATGLVVAGAVAITAGLAWDRVFPIIKHLWTSSFVLFSGGLCLMLLGVLYLVIDVWHLRRWAFGFTVLGANAIFAYMIPTFVNFHGVAHATIGGLDRFVGPWKDLLNATVAFAALWLVLWYMYRNRTFVRI